jgi:hypothetical protein
MRSDHSKGSNMACKHDQTTGAEIQRQDQRTLSSAAAARLSMAQARVDRACPLLQGAGGDDGDERGDSDKHGSKTHDLAFECVGRGRPGRDAQTS